MPAQPSAPRAVILSPTSSRRHLMRLVACAHAAGATPEIASSVDHVAARISAVPRDAVILDATAALAQGTDAAAQTAADVARLRARCPDVEVIVVAVQPTAALVAACFRASAIDVVNLAGRPEQALRTAIGRAWARRRAHLHRRRETREIRKVIDELLRDLVKTERRSLELEGQLAAAGRRPQPGSGPHPGRQPVVLLVDRDRRLAADLADRLESAGVITYALVDGETAVAGALGLARRGEPIDLAVVDATLPGSGLEVIRGLRAEHQRLPVLITAPATGAGAAGADPGVCGVLSKPFADLDTAVARIRAQAIRALAKRRQRRYVRPIRQRHEAVLTHCLRLIGELAVPK